MTILLENGQVIIKAGTQIPIYETSSFTTFKKYASLSYDITFSAPTVAGQSVNLSSNPQTRYTDDIFYFEAVRTSTIYEENFPMSSGAPFNYSPHSISILGWKGGKPSYPAEYMLQISFLFDGEKYTELYPPSTSDKVFYDNKIAYGLYYNKDTQELALSDDAWGFGEPIHEKISEIQYPNGTVYDIESKSTVNQNNADTGLKFWSGTQDEYKAITVKDSNTVYNVIDDSSEPQKLSTINPFDFGDSKYTSIPIANASWLKSEGQWNSGNTYPDFYEWVVENAINHEEGFKLSSETYTDYDFVVNTSDKTFKLPLKSKLASGKAVVGNGMTLGLTNGTNFSGLYSSTQGATGLLDDGNSYGKTIGNTSSSGRLLVGSSVGVSQDSTKSGIETDTTGLYLYYYVGDTIQDSKLINMSNVLNEIASIKSNIIIEEYVNGTSGYRIWASGYCEQWGHSTPVSSNVVIGINLLKPYKDTNYQVFKGWYCKGTAYGPASYDATASVYNLATKRTDYFQSYDLSGWSGFGWRTFGYLKEGEY